VAFSAVCLLALTLILVRVISRPFLSGRSGYFTRVAILLGYTAMLTISGGLRSPLVALYALPLAYAGLSLGRTWTLIISVCAAALIAATAALTEGANVLSATFAESLLTAVLPATAIAFIIAQLVARIEETQEELRDATATDSQTGLLNFSAFEAALLREHSKTERLGRAYSLIIVDIDNLQQTNDSLGHEAGNEMISAVAGAITRSIRTSDIAARLGGDEFVVLLLETDAGTAAAISQRIRNHVYSGTLSVKNRLIRANVSLGVANYPRDHLESKELMILADQRMRQDKLLRRPPPASA